MSTPKRIVSNNYFFLQISPKMRGVLIDWLNEVHYQFHLTLETFHMTVSIIDRYLQEVTQLSRKYLQLVGVTALFIASKYEDLFPAEIGDFVYIADNTYTKKQILQMEKQIIRVSFLFSIKSRYKFLITFFNFKLETRISTWKTTFNSFSSSLLKSS